MAIARHQVVELYDPAEPSLPRFVAAQRQGQPVWRITWEHRDKLPTKLAAWFHELSAQGREPVERVVLGGGVGLTQKTAFALARFRSSEICRMAPGAPNQLAAFLCLEPPCRGGGRGKGRHMRPVVIVGPDGERKEYPSISAMARGEHIAQPTAVRRVRWGLPGRGGRTAL